MVRSEIVLCVMVLRLFSERDGHPIPTTLGPGYGHLEQQRGYHGLGRETVRHICR